jgi:hypothetical protein
MGNYNKLVLNTSETKGIVFGSKHDRRPKPQLEQSVKGVTIEQDEEAELLGITLDGQLSWSGHIDKVVVKIGRGMQDALRLARRSTVLVVQALILSHLDYCPVMWSGAAKKDLAKLQLAQNQAAHLALNCTHRTINNMHDSLMVEEKLATTLLIFKKHLWVKCLTTRIIS